MKAPSTIAKTIGTHSRNFITSAQTVVSGTVKSAVGTVTKITSKGLSIVTGGIKSLFSWIPQLLLLGAAAVAAIILIVVLMQRRKKAPAYYGNLEPY